MKKTTNSLKTGNAVRLNKFLAEAGVASRRKADEMIMNGSVSVNGMLVTELGIRINPEKDKIFVAGKQVIPLDKKVYIIFNKPKDCITTLRDERGRRTVIDYVRVRERIFPVGRLDRDTTGVLLLTNDGEFAHGLMHPKLEVKKAYKVTLDKPLLRADAGKLKEGIKLSNGVTRPAEVIYIPGGKNKIVGIIIHEGRNRQIHRMFEAVGYGVIKLDRVSYSGITCEGLARGGWRHLTKAELHMLQESAGNG